MLRTNRWMLGVPLTAGSITLFITEIGSKEFDTITLPYFQIIGLVIFVLYCIKFYIDDYQFISSSFYQVFYYFGMLISTLLISAGAYMYEIAQYGNANGVFWIIILFGIIGLEFGYVGYKSQKKSNPIISRGYLNIFFQKIIIYSTVFVSIYILFRYGSPLTSEGTRVSYWGTVAPSYLSPIRILIFTSFILAIASHYYKKEAKCSTLTESIIIFLYIAIAIFLLGEKFSAAIFYIFSWLIVQSSISPRKKTTKVFFIVLVILLIAFTYVAFLYNRMGIGYDFVIARLPLQGQILWSTLNEDFQIITIGSGLFCNQNCPRLFDIRDFIEQRYLPGITYDLNQESGTSLSGFFPSMPILIIGLPLAGLVHALFSIYLGRVQSQLTQAIRNHDRIAVYLKFTIYFFLIAFWYIGNANTLIIIIASYFVFFVYKHSKRHQTIVKKVHYV